jgi:acyl carrier protein
MLSETDIEAAVVDALRKHCGVEKQVRADSRLAEDLGLDSVGLLTLAVEVENFYRIKLGEDPEHPPRTVADITALVKQRLGESPLEGRHDG